MVLSNWLKLFGFVGLSPNQDIAYFYRTIIYCKLFILKWLGIEQSQINESIFTNPTFELGYILVQFSTLLFFALKQYSCLFLFDRKAFCRRSEEKNMIHPPKVTYFIFITRWGYGLGLTESCCNSFFHDILQN